MANKNLKVSSIISKFYDVQEDINIKGLYEVRPLGKPNAEKLWYFFSSSNATYNSSNKNVAIRDIDQANSGYIDRLVDAYTLAKKENKKIFWLVCVYGDGIGLKADTVDDISWIASVEVMVDVKDITGSLTMRSFPIGAGPAAWSPCCKRYDQDKYFNTTFMCCKDSTGAFVDTYMAPYFELYDNRPHHDLIFENGAERIDLKFLLELSNKEFADTALNIVLKYAKPDDEIYDKMIDPDESLPVSGLHGTPLLKAVPPTIRTKDELSDFVKCGTSRPKYYNRIYSINGVNYVFFMNWYSDTGSSHNPDNRIKFIDWIIEALRRNCTIAYISSEVVTGGKNILLYGVPGAGKSHLIADEFLNDAYKTVRVVFHPDYTYSTFIGKIMPRVDDNNDKLRYEFVPGPFTEVLKAAIYNPSKKVYLVIEEINRGNAAAIFGELFQLLDRYDDGPKAGESELGITNFEISKYIYGDPSVAVKLPSNLWIIGTMNTADQNVFTLDTAFQRRWNPRRIPNDVENSKYSKELIGGSTICWGAFASVVNEIIVKVDQELGGSSDKRLGSYFVKLSELRDREQFAEKVIKYLWDDALKLEQTRLFDKSLDSLDRVITKCEKQNSDPVKAIVSSDIYDEMEKKTKALCNSNVDTTVNLANDTVSVASPDNDLNENSEPNSTEVAGDGNSESIE